MWSRWGRRLGAPEVALTGAYRTEEQWLAAEIVQDIAEMALHAKKLPTSDLGFTIDSLPAGTAPRGVRVSFKLGSAGPLNHDVKWQRHIWSPLDYEELAHSVL